MISLKRVFITLLLCSLLSPALVMAAVFNVSNGNCTGAGSLRDAIAQANASAGTDDVVIAGSVTRINPTCGVNALPDSIEITDSVNIIGPGSSQLELFDNVQWVTPSGNVNSALACSSGNILVAAGNTPFILNGDGNPTISIRGMTFKGNFGVLETRKPATVNLEDIIVRDSYAYKDSCQKPLIAVSGELNMTDVNLFFNKMTNAAPRDAIVWARGNARLERVRFSANRAASQFFWLADTVDDVVTIRESVFSSAQPRITIVGGTANIINTVVAGESGGAGVWGWRTVINLINSSIDLPDQTRTGLGAGGTPAGATHVWIEEGGRATLFNTLVHASSRRANGALPLVGASGAGLIEAFPDSHITDGSGPSGPSSGNPNVAANLVPLAAPSLDSGNDDSAFDPEKGNFPLLPLSTDLVGNPRIQGPAVEKGAYEILSNYTRDDHYTVQQDSLFVSGSASVLDNDTSYVGGAVLQAVQQTSPATGVLNFNADGTFSYQPSPGDYGRRTFEYYMTVNGSPANTAQVVLDIRRPFPVRTAPDVYTINEGVTLSTDTRNSPLANDDLMAFLYSGAKGGILQVVDAPDNAAPGGFDFPADGIFSYTPAPGFSGTDTFTYRVWFEKLGIAGSAETTVTINVLDTNQAPVARDDAYTTQQGLGKVVGAAQGPLANDTDPENNALSVVKKSDPQHGSVSFFSGGAFAYFSSDPAYVGTDSFTYTASDGKAESNVATITITINRLNQPPQVVADKYRLPADSLFTVPARGGVLRNDSDADGDSLTVSLVQDAANGSVQLQADGAFSYRPGVGFSGADSFEYELSDGKDSVIGVVNLLVTPLNQPPLAYPELYTVVQDTVLTVPAPNLLANDSDPENHQLYLNVGQPPVHGSYTFDAAGALVYTPNPGFVGDDVIGYTVSDGELSSSPVGVVIRVTPAPSNAPPLAHNDAWNMQQGGLLSVPAPGLLSNDSDPEGHSLTVDILTSPAVGTFVNGLGGAFTYQPPAGFSGQVSFTYAANDGHADSPPATVLINVGAANTAPLARDDSYAINAGQTLDIPPPGILLNDSDAEGDTLTVLLTSGPANGLLASDAQGGFQYSPAAGFFGVDQFSYRVSDGILDSAEAIVRISVTGSNQAPVALDDAWSTPQGVALDVPAPGVLANDSDPEGHALAVTISGQPANGTLTPHPDGSFTYLPDAGFVGIDSFLYTASDGVIDSNEARVSLNVGSGLANQPPRAASDQFSVIQGQALQVAAPGLLRNDSDPEGHALSAIIVRQPGHGHLVPAGAGGFTYYPDPGFLGTDSFSYRASDGLLQSLETSARVQVRTGTEQIPLLGGRPGLLLLTLLMLVAGAYARASRGA